MSSISSFDIISALAPVPPDPSGNLNSSFHVGVDILNLLLLYELFMFFHV